MRTQQPTTTHQHKCRIIVQSFGQLHTERNVHVAGRTPDPDVPSRETSGFDPCIFQHQCRSRHTHTHTHTHTHFRVDVGKSGKHAEKKGWPERRQACNGMKTKNELRQARRTCSPLQQPAARTGASCRAATMEPTQRMLGRPGGKHENGRPTRK